MNLCLNTSKEYDLQYYQHIHKEIIEVILGEIRKNINNIIVLEECTPNLIVRLCCYKYGWVPGNFHMSLYNLITGRQQNVSKEATRYVYLTSKSCENTANWSNPCLQNTNCKKFGEMAFSVWQHLQNKQEMLKKGGYYGK